MKLKGFFSFESKVTINKREQKRAKQHHYEEGLW
jgi:hypothetical protein